MRLLLYVVIFQQIVVTIVRHCIQKLSLTPFLVIIFHLGSVLNQSVFILYDVKKMSSRKGMYQTDSFKEKEKALLFAPSWNETIYFLNRTVHS